jgi:hypothetical protein
MIQQNPSANEIEIVSELQKFMAASISSWLDTARIIPSDIGIDFIYSNNMNWNINVSVRMRLEIVANPLKMG